MSMSPNLMPEREALKKSNELEANGDDPICYGSLLGSSGNSG
jgi:hypothetical protein